MSVVQMCKGAGMRSRGKARRELRVLMRGVPRFNVYFSKSQAAAALWDYGEDVLADRALGMSDEDLGRIQNIAAHFEDPSFPLPVEGQRTTHNHVNALAAITFFEGQLRPLSQSRRRPEKNRPERFTPTPLPPDAGLPRQASD
jgi:hypothetical protein